MRFHGKALSTQRLLQRGKGKTLRHRLPKGCGDFTQLADALNRRGGKGRFVRVVEYEPAALDRESADVGKRSFKHRQRQIVSYSQDGGKGRNGWIKAGAKQRVAQRIHIEINGDVVDVFGNVPFERFDPAELVALRIRVVQLKHLDAGILVAKCKGIHPCATNDVLAALMCFGKIPQRLLGKGNAGDGNRKDVLIQDSADRRRGKVPVGIKQSIVEAVLHELTDLVVFALSHQIIRQLIVKNLAGLRVGMESAGKGTELCRRAFLCCYHVMKYLLLIKNPRLRFEPRKGTSTDGEIF